MSGIWEVYLWRVTGKKHRNNSGTTKKKNKGTWSEAVEAFTKYDGGKLAEISHLLFQSFCVHCESKSQNENGIGSSLKLVSRIK